MRAVVVEQFGPPEALRVRDTPAPVPGPGEVLVEIHAAPVNYVDVLVVGGVYQFMPTLPFIPGKSPAGIVVGGRTRGDLAGGRRPGAGDRRVWRVWRGRDARSRSMPPPAGRPVLLGRRRDGRGLRHLVGGLAQPGAVAAGRDGAGARRRGRGRPCRGAAGTSHGRARPGRHLAAGTRGGGARRRGRRDHRPVARQSARRLARPGLCRDRRARRRCHHRSARRTRFSRRRCGHWRGAAGWW